MNSFEFRACDVLCGHFDCESKRATYVAKEYCWGLPQPQKPAPEVEPLPPQPRPQKLRKRRPVEPRRRLVVAEIGRVEALGFKFVVPAHQELALRRKMEWAERMERKPSFLTIAGVRCPPIRGSWMMYIRRKGESLRAYRRRIRGMVAARDLAREVKEQERYEELSPLAQLTTLLARQQKRPAMFQPLREQKLDGPDTEYVWKKQPWERKLRSPKEKNLVGAEFADQCLLLKIQRHYLNAERRAGIALRRQKLRAVVLIDRCSHQYQGKLANALINLFEKAARNDPKILDSFVDDGPIVGQGDDKEKDASGSDNVTATDKKSNVVMEDMEGSSKSEPLPKSKEEDIYTCVSVEQTKIEQKTFVDRWILLKEGVWSSEKSGDTLFSFDLPRDLFNKDEFKTSPNSALFKNHVYWRGNMEIKIVINGSSRQMGMAQVRFYNCAFADKNFSNRNNIYTGSQMPHVLLNASFSNTGELSVPFQYINPLLNVSKGSITWDAALTQPGDEFANLGKLVCLVICPLIVAQTTPKYLSYSVFISFSNSEFAGLIDTRLVDNSYNPKGQMFSLGQIVRTASAVAESLDPNRDNPTVSFTGLPVIPVNSSSWCLGTNIGEYSNVLRLNPAPVTPYAPGRNPPVDEMTNKFVSSTFQLVKILTINAGTPSGTQLWKFDAAPLWDLKQYPRVNLLDGGIGFCVPPVGVLTSMFSWWRGSLVLKINIVGAVEVTGRILVAYVPRYYQDLNVTAALNCNCALFDIQRENREFSFKIPYMADRPFWDRPRVLEDDFENVASPGTVYIFNYTRLIANSTIPDTIFLLCSIAGGDDFEVSVPACPLLGNSFYSNIYIDPNSDLTIVPKDGYWPLYSGNYHSLSPAVCFRYGQYSNQVAPFRYQHSKWQDVLYQICPLSSDHKNSNSIKYKISVKKVNDYQIITVKSSYAVFLMDHSDFIYGISLHFNSLPPTAALVEIREYLKQFVKEHVNELGQCLPSWFWTGYGGMVQKSDVMLQAYASDWGVSWKSSNWWPTLDTASEYWEPEIMPVFTSMKSRGQGPEERKGTDSKITAPIKGACPEKAVSNVMYNEKFFDLKDFTRRYHLYAKGVVKFTEKDINLRTILMKFPALPQGLDLTNKSGTTTDPYWNRTREGVIPLIASGYRFYCGGLRFRIVLDVQKAAVMTATDAKVFVQHRPDILNDTLSVIVRSETEVGQDDVELPGYASYHQFDCINNVISVEIPYYAPCVKLLLQRPTDNNEWARRWSTLGQVAVGVTFANAKNLEFSYEVYYSLADDARFSVFCGFPPMIDITRIPSKPIGKSSLVHRNQFSQQPKVTIIDNEIPSTIHREIETEAELFGDREYEALDKKQNVYSEDNYIQERYSEIDFRDRNYRIRRYRSLRGKRTLYWSQEEFEMYAQKYINITPENWGPPCHYFFDIFKDSTDRRWYGWLELKSAKVVGQGLTDWMPWGNTSKAIDNLSQVDPTKVNDALDSVKEVGGFMNNFKETMKSFIPSAEGIKCKLEKYMSLVINLVTNLVHCLLNLNIKSIIAAIVSIFTQIKLVSITFSSKVIDSMYTLFSKLSSLQQKEEAGVTNEIPSGQGPDDEVFDLKEIKNENERCQAAYLSTLVVGIASLLGVGVAKWTGTSMRSLMYYLLDGIKVFTMTANCVFTFIKNNLICVQKIGNWLVDDSVKVKDIAFLKDQQQEIYKWCLEAIELTDPWKEKLLFMSMRKASRIHELSFSGSIIMARLGSIKMSNQQFRVMEKLLERVNKLKDRLVKAHMAPPVRFEPFVYEITGATGTGKSQILQELPIKMFKAMNMTFVQDVIYHRQLGNQWWNGCVNQPVCSIDEKFPISKPGFDDVQLAELFQLKSRCVFNPPMPDLPDKNLRYNPLIVQYASNNPFPPLLGLLDPIAVFRRRDVLISVQFTRAMLTKYSKLIQDEGSLIINKLERCDRQNYNCLEFFFKPDVKKEDTVWDGPYTYFEFEYIMINKFYHYYFEEEIRFRENLRKALSLQPKEDGDFELSSFDKMWRSQVELNTGEEDIREFKNVYNEIMQDKKLLACQRQPKMFAALRKASGETPLSEVEIKQRIMDCEEKLKKYVATRIDGSKCERKELVSDKEIKGQGPTLIELMNKKSEEIGYEMHAKSIYPILTEFKSTLCPHSFLSFYQQMYPNSAKFEKDKNCWGITESDADHFLQSVCGTAKCSINDRLKIGDFPLCIKSKHGEWKDNHWYIKHEACEGEVVCPFKTDIHLLTRNWLNADPTLKIILQNCDIARLSDYAPDSYIKFILDSVENKQKEIESEKHKALIPEVEKVKTWYETIRDYMMEIPWKKWFHRLAIVLGVFFFFGSIYKVWGFVTSPDPVEVIAGSSLGMNACLAGTRLVTGEVHASGDYKQGTTKKDTPRQIANRVLESIPKGQMDSANFDNMKNILKRNTIYIEIHDNENKKFKIFRCFGICGRTALTYDHAWEAVQNFSKEYKSTKVRVVFSSQRIPYKHDMDLSELKYIRFPNSSLGLITLPMRLSLFRDIRSRIAPKLYHTYQNGIGIMAESDAKVIGDSVEWGWNFHHIDYVVQPSLKVQGGHFFSDFEMADGYRYKNFSGAGKCGSLLMATSLQQPIVGMHVAGSDHFGYSEAIYKEMFDHLSNANQPSQNVMPYGNGDSFWYVDGEVVGIGAVSRFLAARANEKSRIIPSKVQKDPDSPFKVYTDVSVLSPKDPRIAEAPFSPMLEGVKFHGMPLLPFNQQDLELAMEDYENVILANCIPERVDIGILPIDVAIGGIEGREGYEHIEWNSSEGFPFVAHRPSGVHNKRWLFEFNEDGKYCGIHSMLDIELKRKWKLRMNNIIPDTIFTDCLKDCRVAKEKVLQPGKTRIFSIAPVDFTIQQRQCTLDFNVAFMKHRLNLEHAIGINPDSMEWAVLAEGLLSKGDSIVTGDYSKFGDTIPCEIVHGFFRTIANWYQYYGGLTAEHAQQLFIMGFEIANSKHLMFDLIYQVLCGQPSGNGSTVILNSYANSIYIRLAWLAIMRNSKFCSLADFHKHVKLYSYGDDIIIGLSFEIRDLFNAEKLRDFFLEHGLKFTNADKSDSIVKYTNLSEADFLKRGFQPHPYRESPRVVLAPLTEASIIDTVNWVNSDSFGKNNPNCESYISMSMQVCEDALRNSFGRGPQFYSKFKDQLTLFWRKHRRTFIAPTWEQLDTKVFEQGEILFLYGKR